MRSPRRPVRAVSMACAAVLATIAPTAAVAPPQATDDIAQVVLGLGAELPAPGYGVAMSALMTDGRHLDIILETGADGLTRRIAHPAESDTSVGAVARAAAGGAQIMGGGGPCSDDAHNLLSMKWFVTWDWWFHARSTPREITTKAKAENQLRAAVASITGSRNDCGMADTVGARATYQGRTTTRPNINGNYSNMCRPRDGLSVVGFGDLPRSYLGITCTTYQVVDGGVDRAIESDVLLNKDDFGWRASVAGCTTQAILRSVATHEFGHVFGLDHVSEGNHGGLTMSDSIGACDDSAFTLGWGDVLGLRRRY